MEWTGQQLEAIGARGGDILLSAAAGSGKTAVLVERVMSLIEEDYDIDRMLIVTFTRAAASDMRKKLISRLSARAAGEPRFRRQLELIDYASISTIHTLCSRLIRSFFQAADVDPAFKVIEEAEARRMAAAAMRETLEEAYSGALGDIEPLSDGRDAENIEVMIRELHSFLMARPDPWGWLEGCADSLDRCGLPWLDVLCDAAARRLSDARAISLRARERAELAGGLPHYVSALEGDIEFIDGALQMDYEGLSAALARPGYATLRGGGKDDPEAKAIKDMRDSVKKIIKKAARLMDIPAEYALEDARALAPGVRVLAALTRRYDEIFEGMKDGRSYLTFSDLEHRTLRVLRDPEAKAAIAGRYDIIMVDEYQDVSDIQDAIFRALSSGGDMFMVGDVKQSIYRFRQAEPSLFIGSQRRYAEGGGGRALTLNKNFRSRSEVLAFVNAVFEKVMCGGDSEIEYDQDAALVPGAGFDGAGAPVEIDIITGDLPGEDSEEDDGEEGGEDEGGADADREIADMHEVEAEGRAALKYIREHLGSEIYDAKAGAWRELRPRDFVILSRRSKGVLPQMAELLLREGIPAYADANAGYFDIMEVRTVVALMRLIDNGRHDIGWLSALRSPIMGLTSTELAEIRAEFPSSAYCDAVAGYMELENPLAGRLKEFSDKLVRWRGVERVTPLPIFLGTLLVQTGYYAYVGALPGGEQRQANLDLLVVRATEYESQNDGGLNGFLSYVSELTEVGDGTAAHVMGEEDDVVRLMTVHKSKGLEFPVVLCVQMGSKLERTRKRSEICMHRELGLGMELIDRELHTRRDTVARRAVAEKLGVEAFAEELRVLYVMLTRASDRLVMIGSEKGAERAAERYRMHAEGGMTPHSFLDIVVSAASRLNGSAQINWLTRDMLPPPAAARPAELEPNQEDIEELYRDFTWKYPHEGADMLPLKLTASGLSYQIEGPDAPVEPAPRPAFITGEQGPDAAERGTAIHRVMQNIDLGALRAADAGQMVRVIRAQIDEMSARGILAGEPEAELDADMIARFFAGDLGARVLASDSVRREYTFNLRMAAREVLPGSDSDERLLVQGSIDMCFIEGGEWVLIDYKTDRRPDDELLVRYRSQVGIYKLALERITGVRVKEAYICMLRSGWRLPVG